jgi:hypothetical protein
MDVMLLLKIWEKTCSHMKWDLFKKCTLTECVLHTLLLGTIERSKNTMERSNKLHPKQDKAFVLDAHFNVRMICKCSKQLNVTELFFASLIVAKNLLDIDERISTYIIDRTFWNNLRKMVTCSTPTQAPIRKKNYKIMNQLIFHLHLYALDVTQPLGYISLPFLSSKSIVNSDDKLLYCLEKMLCRPVAAIDFYFSL